MARLTIPDEQTFATFTVTTSTSAFPITFSLFAKADLRVQVNGVALDQSAFTFTGTLLEGGGYDGGTVTLTDAAVGTVAIFRDVRPQRTSNFAPAASTPAQVVDAAFNRLTANVQDQRRDTDRALKLPIGDSADVGVVANGQYLARNADGDFVGSSGTGNDSALRTDIAANTGAGLIGTTLTGSVQYELDALALVQSRAARDYPPWSAGVYYGDVWPSSPAGYNIAAVRMSAILILVRVFHDNIVDEYVFKDPSGEGSDGGVAGGWQLVSWRGFVNGRVKLWLEQPQSWGARTTTEFALRIVNLALYSYNSSGETNEGAYRGYGHGGEDNTPANNTIILSGAGANLQSIVNWPVGTRLYGSSLAITCTFFAKFFGTATQAVQIVTNSVLNATQGLSETITWNALIADVGWNDSYAPLHAVNAGVSSNRAKLGGQTAITLTRDGTQKGNWHTTSPAPVLQFYDVNDPTVLAVVRSVYGPPMRKNGVSISPAWELNSFGRVHVTDDADFSKFRVFVASSEEIPPRTAWPMLVGDTYTTLSYRRTEYLPGGPT